jgi:hypothetical protein
MPLTLPYPTFTAGTVIDPTAVNANNTAIVTKFAGNLNNADLAADAGIAYTKLAAYYEHLDVHLIVYPAMFAAGWPGGNIIAAGVPVPGVAGDTPWTVTAVTWCCTDTGGGTGTFDVLWGYFTGGAFVSSTALLAAATTITQGAGANDSNDGTSALAAATVDVGFTANSPHHFVLRSTGADATTLTGGQLYNFLSVTVRMRRAISAG